MKGKFGKKSAVLLGVLLLAIILAVPCKAAGSETSKTETSAEATTKAEQEVKLKKKDSGYFCYVNKKMVKSKWMTIKDKTYYFKKNGAAATLSTKIKGKYYVFNKKGVLQEGKGVRIVTIGKKKYQVAANGTAKKGWSKNKKYYFYNTGEMVKGIEVFNGKFYSFNSSTGKYNAAKTTKLRKAAKYEKDFSTLKKLIGKPKKSSYYSSCYGDGKDGVLKYKNFKVYTFKYRVSGKEIYMGAD